MASYANSSLNLRGGPIVNGKISVKGDTARIKVLKNIEAHEEILIRYGNGYNF